MLFVVNWAIRTGLLILFSLMGWVTLLSDGAPTTSVTWQVVGIAALVAIIFTLVSWLVVVTWLVLGIASLGIILLLGIILFPFIGWAILALTAAFAPGMVVLHSFWITVLCGFILMIAQISRPKTKTVAASSTGASQISRY